MRKLTKFAVYVLMHEEVYTVEPQSCKSSLSVARHCCIFLINRDSAVTALFLSV